ncbi:MAG: imidazole glycerol phosphate synthase subunit HisF [Candidatus Gygaella obscura]|nr:imidazole glycerol phosphate synthase subunit HisF [Candidatus Gygaella obscura]
MLTKRIIPCLDVKNGRVVKGVKFINLKDAGDPVENASFYDRQGADELVFLDITASFEKRNTILNVVKRIASQIFMPLTVGGGVRNVNDVRNLLNAGADKVSINTAAVKNPSLVKEAAKRFGSQCIVVAIDAKRISTKIKKWQVFIKGGRENTFIDVIKWVKKVESLGAGEILLTSMDKDGTKDGFDIELTKEVSKAVKIPVIASGGAGSLDDFYDVFKKTAASAGLAASLFHYRQLSVNRIKQYLKKKKIKVRI